MTRFACKLGLALVAAFGVLAFTAAPAEAHPHGHVVVVERPRVFVPAYYPRAVYVAPAPVIRPVYPVYPVYPVAPIYAPAPVLGAGIRLGPVGIGIGIR